MSVARNYVPKRVRITQVPRKKKEIQGPLDRSPPRRTVTSKKKKKKKKKKSSMAGEKWRAVHGSEQWEGLLDPLDSDLREAILRYGDLVQATYDAFNNDAHSRYAGSSRYGKKDFFHKVAFAPAYETSWDYQVTRFLYATSLLEVPEAFVVKSLSREAWSRESNWIGYVALGTHKSGRKEIAVAWRGTTRDLEWADVFNPRLESVGPLLPLNLAAGAGGEEEKVMNGWFVIYTSSDPRSRFAKTSARDQFVGEIRRLVELHADEPDLSITVAGHSLGAALSILSAYDLVENGVNRVPGKPGAVPVTAVVFGSPGVGNAAFARRFRELPGLRALHVVNVLDMIPHYPGKFLRFGQVGTQLRIDTRKSPYLKDSKNPSDWHNLQAHLHLVSGWEGADKEFRVRVNRSVALVNKSSDFLKEECLVPPSWWVEKNKGMVQDEHGMWSLAEPQEDDLPKPED